MTRIEPQIAQITQIFSALIGVRSLCSSVSYSFLSFIRVLIFWTQTHTDKHRFFPLVLSVCAACVHLCPIHRHHPRLVFLAHGRA